MDDRATVARRAARGGGTTAKELFRTELAVETKADATDFVTRADHEAQSRVVEELDNAGLEAPVVGEEEGIPSRPEAAGPCWVVDPIDGTNNFVRGSPLWTTSVCCLVDGEPLAAATVAPVLGELFIADDTQTRHNGTAVSVSDQNVPELCSVVPTLWWDHDSRDEYASVAGAITRRFGDLKRYGSTQLELASLAAGVVDGVVSNRQGAAWDTVAGVHLVRQAGGTVTDRHGERWQFDSEGLVASNGAIHDAVLDTVSL